MANTTLKFGNGEWYGKKDTILAYNDLNSNYKPLPFDFSRGSSATVINKDGLIETVGSGEPRIDYKDNSKGAMLLEPSRSNLIAYSNKFDTYWSLLGLGTGSIPTIINNSIISPDGNQNATEVILNVGNGTTTSDRSSIEVPITVTQGSEYSISFYIKGKNDGDELMIGAINGGYELITLTTEWKRYTITQTAASSPRSVFIGIRQGVFGTLNSNVEFYLYGTQLEAGSYATSYIPTQGGVVTRLADECEQTPPSGVVGQTELTIFYQGIVERLGGNDGHAITLSQSADGAGSSRVLLYRNSSNGNMYVYVQDTTTQFSTPLLANSNPQINDKYAIAIKDNDLVVYCNGVKVSENNSGTIPATQYLILNKWNNQINQQNKTKEVKLYNTRLSNSELQALTTI